MKYVKQSRTRNTALCLWGSTKTQLHPYNASDRPLKGRKCRLNADLNQGTPISPSSSNALDHSATGIDLFLYTFIFDTQMSNKIMDGHKYVNLCKFNARKKWRKNKVKRHLTLVSDFINLVEIVPVKMGVRNSQPLL